MRHVARFLAPLAIAAVALGIYLIVHGNLGTHSAPRVTVTRSHPVHHRRGRHRTSSHASPTYYTVRSGDTLSSIAQRSGVSLGRIEALNPKVAPSSLHTGERIEVRR